jgi:hypothetical protein
MFDFIGGCSRTRTCDPLIKSPPESYTDQWRFPLFTACSVYSKALTSLVGRASAGNQYPPVGPPRRGVADSTAPEVTPACSAPDILDAEKALLGAVVITDDNIERVPDFICADNFSDPSHQQICERASRLIAAPKQAPPITPMTFSKAVEPVPILPSLDVSAVNATANQRSGRNAMMRPRHASPTRKKAAELLHRDGQMQISDGLIYQFSRFAATILPAPSATEKGFHDGQQRAFDI